MSLSKPHPLNAPGDFFVGNEECIACGAPEAEAPTLMSHTGDNHCCFVRQPTTTEEIDQAVNAIAMSWCQAVYYAGSDVQIVSKLEKLGSLDCCLATSSRMQASKDGFLTRIISRFLFRHR